MKIAVIDTTIDAGPIARPQAFLPQLLKGLISNGSEVHLITKRAPHETVRREIEGSKAILHTDLWQADGFVEETAPVLAKWLNEFAPDIYLISNSADIGWVVLPLLDPRIAAVTIGHTDSEALYLPVRHYRSFLTRAIGVGPEVCVGYVLSCVIDKERVEWIPYGVPADDDQPSETGEDVLKLIYVGRLAEGQTRVSDLVRIVKLLSEKGVNFTLQIIGEGEERVTIEEELAQEIGSGKVVLRGRLEDEESIKAMLQAEVFVSVTASEDFNISLAEAMSNGCAAVAAGSKSGATQLIKDGANGFLIGIGDTETFAEKLKYLGQNRPELLKMRHLAQQTGRAYGIAKMVGNYETCFEKAIEDAAIAPREIYKNYPLPATCRSHFPLWVRRLRAKTKLFVSAR